jgi:type-F conjugative transfer system pilin assembly protein TrbC
MDSLEGKELLHGFSVSLIALLFAYSFAIAEDMHKVSIEIPTPCHKVDKIDGNKVYLKSSDKPCIQVISRTYIDIHREITSVYTYIDGAMWKEQKVMPVEDGTMDAKADIKKFMPKPEDLEKVRQFESFKRQEHIENAQKYEYLKDNVNIDKVQDIVLPQNKKQTAKIDITALQGEKQKYIFYLFSKSIPDIAVESVFNQSKKLDINFYGVLRGIDRERAVLEKVKDIKEFEDITIKVNPLIFKAVGAQVVPAIVYAYCPPPAMFRSADCDYKYVVYGDISLMGALEVMGRHDSEAQRLYEELLNAF